MDTFEYAMVLVSIVVGLGVTHLLAGLGQAINRLQDQERPITIEPTYLLWVGFVFFYLIGFWWWEYKFSTADIVWSLDLYYFVIIYAVTLYLMTTILVPWQMQGVTSALEHLLSRRRWFFGLLLLATALDLIDTFLKGAAWGQRPGYIAFEAGIAAICICGIFSDSKRLHFTMAVVIFSWQLIYSLSDLTVLGSF